MTEPGAAIQRCPSCRRDVPADERRCPFCRSEIPMLAAPPTRAPSVEASVPACVECGKTLESGWVACPACGAPRTGRKSAAAGVLAVLTGLGAAGSIAAIVLGLLLVAALFAIGALLVSAFVTFVH